MTQTPYNDPTGYDPSLDPSHDADGKYIKPEDRELMRQQGTMILFPSVFTHRITEITKGERYSFVSWANGPNYI